MSHKLPSVKPRAPSKNQLEFNDDGTGFGPMAAYTTSARSQIAHRHPLEHVLKNSAEHQEALTRSLMFNAQGPAGPMIRAMELRATSSVGRLPFLESSNFQRDVLTGRDEEIDFEDVFALMPQCSERINNPHRTMETVRFRSF